MRQWIIKLGLITALSIMFIGCATSTPPPKVEPPPPPRPGWVWVPGHWEGKGQDRHWISGEWQPEHPTPPPPPKPR